MLQTLPQKNESDLLDENVQGTVGGIDELPYKSAQPGRASFAANIRGKVKDSRNMEIKTLMPASARHGRVASDLIHPGQLETTEEVLRKHYFMAKAT